MRQLFTSPRLENVEQLAQLLDEAGIENKISEGRSYRKYSRRDFSYIEKQNDTSSQPAVWVIKSDDYKRARELLHGAGLLDKTQVPSYVPPALQFRQASADPAKRLMRIKLTLLLVIGALAGMMALRMFF